MGNYDPDFTVEDAFAFAFSDAFLRKVICVGFYLYYIRCDRFCFSRTISENKLSILRYR